MLQPFLLKTYIFRSRSWAILTEIVMLDATVDEPDAAFVVFCDQTLPALPAYEKSATGSALIVDQGGNEASATISID